MTGPTGPAGPGPSPSQTKDNPFKLFAEERTEVAAQAFFACTFPSVLSADAFFQAHGIGNDPRQISLPYERYFYYDLLLTKLARTDIRKYKSIHKGTPFYFLGWTSFDFGDFDKAVFYLDAAFAEDLKNVEKWAETPAAQFLSLQEGGSQAAAIITGKLRQSIISEFSRFNCTPGHTTLNINDFIDNFIKRIWTLPSARSIISALYSFIKEYDDRKQMLILRGCAQGSIEPFLVHLFKGGLIFESILKQLYVLRDPKDQLGKIFRYPDFKADFSINIDLETSSSSLEGIITGAQSGWTSRVAFETTAKIRNTSGHNLAWPDPFNNPSNYELLFQQIINAIFYVIAKKYIDP